MEISGKVAVIGVGYARPTRRPRQTLGLDTLAACRAAIADAGLKPSDIDGLGTCSRPGVRVGLGQRDGVDFVTPHFLRPALGLAQVAWQSDTTDSGSIGAAFIAAANAVAAGACNYAIVWRALTYPRGQRYGHVDPDRAEGIDQFAYPYGFLGPGAASRALPMRRYLDVYGGTREQMATLAVNNRKNSLLNENSYWTTDNPVPLTSEDYLGARMIADPLCLYDCDIPVHGCAAWVLTGAARASSAPRRPAYLLGYATGTGSHRPNIQLDTMEELVEGARTVGKRLWANTGVGPKDVGTANLYDGFSTYTYLWLEGLGFCGEGEALQFVQNDRVAIGGELPLNTGGGNLGEGRLHGAPHISEAILQASGRAGQRQTPDARITLAAIMPPSGGVALVFSSEKP